MVSSELRCVLKEWRDQEAKMRRVSQQQILASDALSQICTRTPNTAQDLLCILSRSDMRQHGAVILHYIRTCCGSPKAEVHQCEAEVNDALRRLQPPQMLQQAPSSVLQLFGEITPRNTPPVNHERSEKAREEQVKMMLKLKKKGLTVADIAEIFNAPQYTVANLLGLPPPLRTVTFGESETVVVAEPAAPDATDSTLSSPPNSARTAGSGTHAAPVMPRRSSFVRKSARSRSSSAPVAPSSARGDRDKDTSRRSRGQADVPAMTRRNSQRALSPTGAAKDPPLSARGMRSASREARVRSNSISSQREAPTSARTVSPHNKEARRRTASPAAQRREVVRRPERRMSVISNSSNVGAQCAVQSGCHKEPVAIGRLSLKNIPRGDKENMAFSGPSSSRLSTHRDCASARRSLTCYEGHRSVPPPPTTHMIRGVSGSLSARHQ